MATNTPLASDSELLLPEYYGTHGYPYSAWARLRRGDPVHRVSEWAGDPYWAITRHREITKISKRPELFRNTPRFNVNPKKGIPDEPFRNLLNMDPPEHRDYRMLVSHRFTPRALTRIQSNVDQICDQVIDEAAAEQGSVVDFVEQIAARMPILVIAEMIGVPRADWEQMYHWTNISVGATDPEFQQGRTTEETRLSALEDMGRYFSELVAERRRSPRDDISSDLSNARIHGELLPEKELLSYFSMLLAAGNETTRNATTGGLILMIEHPEQLDRLKEDLCLLDSFVEEILRMVSPVIHMSRTPIQDVELAGKKICRNEPVVLFFPSGNRDEQVFENPDSFRIDRDPNPHVAFGIGEHFCLGSHVARMELRAIFKRLVQRLDHVEIAGRIDRLQNHVVGGIKRMPVRLRLRAAA